MTCARCTRASGCGSRPDSLRRPSVQDQATPDRDSRTFDHRVVVVQHTDQLGARQDAAELEGDLGRLGARRQLSLLRGDLGLVDQEVSPLPLDGGVAVETRVAEVMRS